GRLSAFRPSVSGAHGRARGRRPASRDRGPGPDARRSVLLEEDHGDAGPRADPPVGRRCGEVRVLETLLRSWRLKMKKRSVEASAATKNMVLPTDSDQRKQIPIFSGVLNYFPLAIAAVARVSKRGNDQHNPGQLMHWARGKSTDHEDCIARHLIDVETLTDGEYEDAAALAWRALAKLQELEERRLGKAPSRGSR